MTVFSVSERSPIQFSTSAGATNVVDGHALLELVATRGISFNLLSASIFFQGTGSSNVTAFFLGFPNVSGVRPKIRYPLQPHTGADVCPITMDIEWEKPPVIPTTWIRRKTWDPGVGISTVAPMTFSFPQGLTVSQGKSVAVYGWPLPRMCGVVGVEIEI